MSHAEAAHGDTKAPTAAPGGTIPGNKTSNALPSPGPATPTLPHSTKKPTTKKEKRDTSLITGLHYNTPTQKQKLDKCDWPDRLIYASRMLLGGNNVNGFLRGTATAQRIKKQRARQIGITKKAAAAASGIDFTDADKKEKKIGFDQMEEEKLKLEVMNPRTAKKLKVELEASLNYCAQIHNLLRGVIFDIDNRQGPHLPPHLFFESDKPDLNLGGGASLPVPSRPIAVASPGASTSTPGVSNMPWKIQDNKSAPTQPKGSVKNQTTASPGNPEGSTFRKMRKRKLPPNTEAQPNIPEVDGSGRRLVNKKEHCLRVFEILRFRRLRAGDFVAARTTSRELWILARVMKEYGGIEHMAPLEFLQLSETRRDAMFKNKVEIKDVEGDGHTFQVARSLVLPLPRTYSEASDWGSRIKKGMRVYAMYPNTTSLYPATVFDSTTYCRDDDDIIVVEFDGEEPDETGTIQKFHIPARFVTLIPREFPSSLPPSTTDKRKSSNNNGQSPSKQQKTDDFLNFDFDGNFDALDLDFDKPLAGHDDDDSGFPPLL